MNFTPSSLPPRRNPPRAPRVVLKRKDKEPHASDDTKKQKQGFHFSHQDDISIADFDPSAAPIEPTLGTHDSHMALAEMERGLVQASLLLSGTSSIHRSKDLTENSIQQQLRLVRGQLDKHARLPAKLSERMLDLVNRTVTMAKSGMNAQTSASAQTNLLDNIDSNVAESGAIVEHITENTPSLSDNRVVMPDLTSVVNGLVQDASSMQISLGHATGEYAAALKKTIDVVQQTCNALAKVGAARGLRIGVPQFQYNTISASPIVTNCRGQPVASANVNRVTGRAYQPLVLGS